MKKILSLMCALWACVMMDFAMEVAVPATVLDLQNPTSIEAGWYGTIAYSLSTNALVVSGYESYKSVDKQTWITQESVGSTGIDWAGEAPFKGSAYYSNATAAQLNSSRHIAYLITGCDSIWCYGYNNSATCYLAMNIYELTDAPVAVIDDATATKTYSLDNSAAGGKASGIMKQALDATKTYLVEAYGTGTSNSRVFEMAFFRHPKAAEMKTIYCKMEHNWWTKDGAAIAAYAWKEGGEANAELFPGERMTAVEAQSGLWKIELDVAKFTQVIFTRVNASGELQNWGAQTEDLTIPTDDKNLFTITNAEETWAGLEQKCTGEWSKYDPSSTPVDPGDKVAIRLVPGVWNLDGAKFAAITFTEMPADMNPEALANAVISDWFVGGDTVVGLIPDDAKVIGFGRFNPETTELTLLNVMAEGTMWNHSDIMYIDESRIYTITGWEDGKDYCPGYWGEGSVDPETKEISLVPGSWASDNAIFAAWAWPQGKEGTWSVFQGSGETLRANISAAADSILFVRFVEKVTTPEWDANLIAYKTADFKIEDCGLFYFDDQTWCAPATPDENDFYITGDEALVGQDKEWNPAAIPVKGTSYTFTNLPAGSYKLKVTVNGNWTTAKGYGDLTTVTENLSKDKADNICFTLGEAGDVVVTYTATVFTVEGKFVTPPEPQKVEIRLVPGVWNLDGAKFAAITFTEMPADMNPEALANAVISDWFVGGDTVVGLIPDDAKVIGFGRFNPETTELTLLNVMAEGTMWNHSDIIYIDESRIYTITGWEDGKDYCPGYWGNTPPQPAEDEWFLVGDMTDWQDGKISFANGPISATLKDEGRTYGMKILKINGDKETWYSNKGIMERSNCSGWEFTVDVQDNSGLIVDQAGVYTFSMSVNEFGNPVVTVQYPVGEGLEDIDASVKAVKVVHGGQVLILRGEHIFTVMGQQVK